MAPPWKLFAEFFTHSHTSTGVFGLRIIRGIPKEGEKIEKIEAKDKEHAEVENDDDFALACLGKLSGI